MRQAILYRASGRSLVELMIAITIGLLILTAISALFVSNNSTAKVSDDKSRLEEDGRLALYLLTFHIRMAGYGTLIDANPNLDVSKTKTIFEQAVTLTGGVEAIEGCSAGFVNPRAIPAICDDGKTGDALIVRYFADNANANNTAGNLPMDCLGQGVKLNPVIVENRFFIATNPTTNIRELYCAGNGGTKLGEHTFASPPQPIAENVTDMRLVYGYDSDGDQSVNGFYTAAQLRNPTVVSPPSATESTWSRVVSVRVCLVMQSANDNIVLAAQKYRDCDGNLVTATDRRLHSAFSTVVTLRGRSTGSAS